MARLKIADVRDRGFALNDIFSCVLDNGTEIRAWFAEQGFRWKEIRISSAWWLVFDTPAQAVAFKIRWL